MRYRIHVVTIALLAAALFGINLGQAPLWDRDEPRNAACAREMQARGDWVVPVFNDELRTHKPVLLYWLMMSAYSLFGVTEFSARVSSAIVATGTVLLTYGIGKRLFTESAGTWSALILATSLLFTMSARAATPDATLVFFSTLALWFFVQFAFPDPSQAGRWRWQTTCAVYGAMGLAVLAKGPVGVVLPAAVLATFSWVDRGAPRSPRSIARMVADMRPLTGLLVLLAVAGPWYLWVGLRTDGVWLREFFGEHNLGRALHPMEGHDGPAFLYYPLSIMVGFFPWSIVLTPLVIDLIDQRRAAGRFSPSHRLVLTWLAIYLVVFSLAQTKLPSYLLPAYPAVALLIGSYLDRRIQGATRTASTLYHTGFAVQVVVGIVLVGLVAWAAHELLPASRWLAAIGFVPIIFAIVGFWSTMHNDLRLQSRVLLGTATLLNVGIFAIATTEVGSYQQCDQLLRSLATDPSTGSLVAFGRCEPSWVYYAGRPIRCFTADQQDLLDQHLAQEGAVTVIATREDADELVGMVPVMQEEIPYFLRHGQLTARRYIAAGYRPHQAVRPPLGFETAARLDQGRAGETDGQSAADKPQVQ